MHRFEGTTAVVVGAVEAVGRACAARLAAEGAVVVGVGETHEALASLESALGDGLRLAVGLVADSADPADMDSAARACVDAGLGADVLVNCQFAIDWCSIEDSTTERWVQVVRTNLLGPVVCSKAFLPLLRASRRAAIVHLGSIDGTLGNPKVPSYSASKGGLVPLTHVMAHEFAAYGIRVNCVARAAVADPSIAPSGLVERAMAVTPLGRPAEAAEVAAAVAFLASTEASYVTGAVLTVDGGRSGLTPGTI